MEQQVATLQGLLFVAATNGASVRACVCVIVCVCACVLTMWACHPEHTERRFQPTLALNFESIRAVQQRYGNSSSSNSSSGTTPANLARLMYTETLVFPLFSLRHPRDFKSIACRRGTLDVHLFPKVSIAKI